VTIARSRFPPVGPIAKYAMVPKRLATDCVTAKRPSTAAQPRPP